MDMRKLLVVASAAAIVTGSSFAAFAGQRHHGSGVSKAESSSSAHLKVRADPRNPECGDSRRCHQDEEGTQLDIWADDWQKATAPEGGEAKASSFAGGIGFAAEVNYHNEINPNNNTGGALVGPIFVVPSSNTNLTGSVVGGAVLVGGEACAGNCGHGHH